MQLQLTGIAPVRWIKARLDDTLYGHEVPYLILQALESEPLFARVTPEIVKKVTTALQVEPHYAFETPYTLIVEGITEPVGEDPLALSLRLPNGEVFEAFMGPAYPYWLKLKKLEVKVNHERKRVTHCLVSLERFVVKAPSNGHVRARAILGWKALTHSQDWVKTLHVGLTTLWTSCEQGQKDVANLAILSSSCDRLAEFIDEVPQLFPGVVSLDLSDDGLT